MKKRICTILTLLPIAFLIISCSCVSNFGIKGSELSQTAIIETAVEGARQTMEIGATLNALMVTPTPIATNTAEPTPEPPTPTPIPSATIEPSPSHTVVTIPCNKAKFVMDVTIPDGKEMNPNESFVKTWRVTNVGSCAWDSSYQLIFSDGDRMSAPSSVYFPGYVSPGSSVDISVHLTSPSSAGSYTGRFFLKAPDGSIYGMGDKNHPVTAVIKVVSPTAVATRTSTPALPEIACQVTSNRSYNMWVDGRFDIYAHIKNTGSKTWGSQFVLAPTYGEEYVEYYFYGIPRAIKSGESFAFQLEGYDPDKGKYAIYITWELMNPDENWKTYCTFETNYIP